MIFSVGTTIRPKYFWSPWILTRRSRASRIVSSRELWTFRTYQTSWGGGSSSMSTTIAVAAGVGATAAGAAGSGSAGGEGEAGGAAGGGWWGWGRGRGRGWRASAGVIGGWGGGGE